MLSLQLVNNLYLAVGVKACVRKMLYSGTTAEEQRRPTGGVWGVAGGIGVAGEGVNEDFLR